jgi:hypothetical protein
MIAAAKERFGLKLDDNAADAVWAAAYAMDNNLFSYTYGPSTGLLIIRDTTSSAAAWASSIVCAEPLATVSPSDTTLQRRPSDVASIVTLGFSISHSFA